VSVLITRPEPDNAATADALHRGGFDVLLAPLLQFQALPFRHDATARHAGLIVTSANALRAVRNHPLTAAFRDAPLFAVGDRTADAARGSGFAQVVSADGDLAALRKLVVGQVTPARRKAPLLYLAGSDVSGDIAAELQKSRIAVVTLTVYRMVAVDRLPAEVTEAFAAHRIEAVLHYSGRSAQSFVAALRAAGLEVAGLAVPQICMSDAVGRVLREAGATRVMSAERPQETAMIDALARVVPSRG
jgi:uroporphyrinogen-III synthase